MDEEQVKRDLEKRSKTQSAIKASWEARKWGTAEEMDEKIILGIFFCNLVLENVVLK
jgi:hypothetical protein